MLLQEGGGVAPSPVRSVQECPQGVWICDRHSHYLKGVYVASHLDLNSICMPSQGVVAREIEGEIVIVPIAAGIGEAEDELYTLNETGQAIWQKLDGRRTLKDVAASLVRKFTSPLSELETDVLGFASELTQRGILVTKV
jgi:hypothetical protein